MIEMQKSKTREIPLWISIPLVLAFLAGGGWVCLAYYRSQADTRQAVPLDQKTLDSLPSGPFWGGGSRNPRRMPPPTSGTGRPSSPMTPVTTGAIRSSGDGVWHVRATGSNVLMKVASSEKHGVVVYPRYYFPIDNPLASGEQQQLFIMSTAISMDRNVRERLKITDGQLAELRKLGPREDMVGLTDAERQKLVELFKKWQSAPSAEKAAADKAVVQALEEVGKSHLTETKAAYAARSERIKAIVAPEQIDQYRQSLSSATTKPAAPTTKPAGPAVSAPKGDAPKPKVETASAAVKKETPATKPAAETPKAVEKPASPSDAAPATRPATLPTK